MPGSHSQSTSLELNRRAMQRNGKWLKNASETENHHNNMEYKRKEDALSQCPVTITLFSMLQPYNT